MPIVIRRYRPEDQAMWDQLVETSRNGTLLHRRGYMDYHSDRFDDCSLLAFEGNRLIATLPANRVGNTLFSHGGLTYGGWILPLRHCDVTVMMDVMDAAVAWMREQGLRRLVYRPVPHIYHRYPCEDDLYALHRCGATLWQRQVSTTVDLECRLPLDRGNRSSLNKARRAGITVGLDDDWEGYWQVLAEVLAERHDARPVHTVEEMRLLAGRFEHDIKLYCARLEGELLAGVVIYYAGPVAHCQYIAANAAGRQLRAPVLLFDHLMDDARLRGCRYFDFGTSNEDGGKVLNYGLVQQKSRLGGRSIVHDTYQLLIDGHDTP